MKKLSKISKIGVLGIGKPRKAIKVDAPAGLTGGGIKQLNAMPEGLQELARRVGDRNAKKIWALRKKGIEGTAPELLTYAYLERRNLVFDFQSSQMGGRTRKGGAVIDFLISGLSANGYVAWLVHGEYWHKGIEVERKDETQRQSLLRHKIGGVPVVSAVSLWENDIYTRNPEVFQKAEAGIGLRG